MDKESKHLFGRPNGPLAPVETRRPSRKWTIGRIVVLALIAIYWITYFIVLQRTSHSPSEDLIAHCTSLLEVPEGYYTSRLDRLVQMLKEHAATWIAEPGPSADFYLGGFAKGDWHLSERPLLLAVQSTGRVTILTPKFEELRARGVGRTDEVEVDWASWAENENPYQVLLDTLGEPTLVVESQVRSFIAEGMIISGKVKMAPVGLGKSISLLRERKDEREIGLLRCANQMTLHAIRETRKRMHLGISESQTKRILDEELSKTGVEGDGGLVLFGGDAALPHGSGTDKKLGPEDLVLIDVGGSWGGYVADITRTFALPKSQIPKKHIEAWEAVRQAQHAPYDLLLRSNTSSPPSLGDLDHAARQVINSKYATEGFDVFTHRLGHGIGLEGHERPYLVPGAGDVPRSGHVFSLEPGIYVPSGQPRGGLEDVGVRLEDCFVVTETDGQLGGEWLSGPVEKWGDI